ncbi:MAG: extracellular solute-binding protein [Phycisphaerae bacterium]
MIVLALLAFLALPGCERPATPADVVTLYTSVDQPFAERIVAAFSRQTGLRVQALYDTEAGKTTGFVRRIQREAGAARCDVWWSSEVFGTIELARAGLLDAYDSPAAADIPPEWRDQQQRWIGLAARARVVAYDPRRIAPESLPATWAELAQPAWAARTALANPQFGTTRGHIAALFAFEGVEHGTALLQSLRSARARIADGNSQTVRLVESGQADLAWTDTDDVWVAQERGDSLNVYYPRVVADGPPLWIPCSVALVRGGPNSAGGRRLVDYLVSAAVERALAGSESRNVPVRAALRAELRLDPPTPEAVDFDRVADALPQAMTAARDILLR